jgi:hypothetical protein
MSDISWKYKNELKIDVVFVINFIPNSPRSMSNNDSSDLTEIETHYAHC